MGIVLGWAIFVLVVYKASQVEIDYTEFDPYFELELDKVSTNIYNFTIKHESVVQIHRVH